MTEEIKGDRVSYSASRKLSDDNFGSYDFHSSYNTTIREGETLQDATKRAIAYVEKILEFKCKQAIAGKLPY